MSKSMRPCCGGVIYPLTKVQSATTTFQKIAIVRCYVIKAGVDFAVLCGHVCLVDVSQNATTYLVSIIWAPA